MPKWSLVLAASVFALLALFPIVLGDDSEAKECNRGHPCPSETPPPTPSSTTPPPSATSSTPPASGDPIITAAGDIADPNPTTATKATAQLIMSINPTVAITLGDNQYPSGQLSDYEGGYDSTWGAFLSKTYPALGNHEYESSSTAAGYFGYFGSRAPNEYYSYEVGAWHLISLDSNCSHVSGCGAGSPQYEWLKADLASHPAVCTLAYWHHPRWSSGSTHGGTTSVAPFWTLLYNAGADVVLNGHEHNYERFAPQDPGGASDSARGIVEIVSGTGGHSIYGFGATEPNSVVRSSTYGVAKLTLHPTSYDFAFEAIPGSTFTDSGTADCH
jgi:calcineurin-like phosphoesterase family protein